MHEESNTCGLQAAARYDKCTAATSQLLLGLKVNPSSRCSTSSADARGHVASAGIRHHPNNSSSCCAAALISTPQTGYVSRLQVEMLCARRHCAATCPALFIVCALSTHSTVHCRCFQKVHSCRSKDTYWHCGMHGKNVEHTTCIHCAAAVAGTMDLWL